MAMVIAAGDPLFQNISDSLAELQNAVQALDQASLSLQTVNRRQVVHTAKDVLLDAMLMMLVPLNRLSAIKRDQGREIPPSVKENGRAAIQRLTIVKQILRDVLALVEINTSDTIEIHNMLIEMRDHFREIIHQYSEMYNNAMIVTGQMNVEGGRRRTLHKRTIRTMHKRTLRKRTMRKRTIRTMRKRKIRTYRK
jgi:hypothetical protein